MSQSTASSGPLGLVTIVEMDTCRYSSSLYVYQPCYSVVGDLMRSNLGWPPATLQGCVVSSSVNVAINCF
eukprot:scaffold6464_cov104-Skeletonema_dohrnii-CCMP3373.AAC.1